MSLNSTKYLSKYPKGLLETFQVLKGIDCPITNTLSAFCYIDTLCCLVAQQTKETVGSPLSRQQPGSWCMLVRSVGGPVI